MIIKKGYITAAKLFLTFLVFALLFFTFDIDLSKILSGIINYKYLLLSLVIPLIIIPIISSNRWKLFLHYVGVEETALTLMKINFISMFQGIVLPSTQGVDVIRIIHIEAKHPEKRGKVGSTILIERMIGFVILCSLSLFFTCVADIPNRNQVLLLISGIFILLLLTITLLLNKKIATLLSQKKFSNHILNSCFQYLNKIASSLAYFPYNKVLLSSIAFILLYQISIISSVYLIFQAYGITIPFITHISLYPIIAILSLIPITISGFGIREGFFVYFYSQLGVPAEIAVSVSLMNYVVLSLVPALLGSILYIIDIFKKKTE